MKKKLALILLVALLLTAAPQPAAAASYSFSVPSETVDVYWNGDGTASLDYTIVFQNDGGASPIDYVDLGVPNTNYDLGSVTASVNGSPVYDIQPSTYVEVGVAVGLGSRAIPSGSRGTVRIIVGRVSQVLYADDTDPNYASAVFSPNWFDSGLVHGNTELAVTFHLPPGVTPDEPRYHTPGSNWPGAAEPSATLDSQGRVAYTWTSGSADPSAQYTFGASFPARVIPAGTIVKQTIFDKLGIWLAGIGAVIGGLLPCVCVGGFIAFFVGIGLLGTWSEKQRKKQYLPPTISIEGHGIKRGLTSVEAALLMEQALDHVLTMILFGVVKKGAAKVVTQEPLKLEITQPAPADLYPYEQDFLKAFQMDDLAARRRALQEMIVAAIKSLQEKMKGFSRKETVEYYKTITEKAWQQVTAAGTPAVQAQAVDDNLEWTMLDRDFAQRSATTFGPRPIFLPLWWGNYSPSVGRAMPTHSFGPAQAGPISLPQLPGADFAASVVHGVQNFSSNVIGDITGFTGNVTSKTNPPPVTASSGGYRGGGGHSCACACACAGCACACAGGGR